MVCTLYQSQIKVRSIKITAEAARADIETAKSFSAEFTNFLRSDDYPDDLTFNVVETGLYWNRMTSRIFLAVGEKSAQGQANTSTRC